MRFKARNYLYRYIEMEMTVKPKLEDFFKDDIEWSFQTFGDISFRGPDGPMKHLIKESVEAMKEKDFDKCKVEIIDCLFIVFDGLARCGHSIGDILELYDYVIDGEIATFEQAFDMSIHLSWHLEDIENLCKLALGAKSNAYKSMKLIECLIAVFNACHDYTMCIDEVVEVAYKKLEKNKKRNWPAPTKDGAVEHIRGHED